MINMSNWYLGLNDYLTPKWTALAGAVAGPVISAVLGSHLILSTNYSY